MHRILETRARDSMQMTASQQVTRLEAAPTGVPARAVGASQIVFIAIPAAAVVLAIYVWFASVGTWTNWPLGGSYYDQLADAFRAGHLWLDRPPSGELLALPNPYDPAARAGVAFVSDASLYHGRYYLYFGPVPALLVAAFKSIVPVLVGDQYLVFAFTAGTFLLLAAFILRLWRRFFPAISPWLVAATVIGAGLISPFTWILGSSASVPDAAIAAGQFFLLLGLYAAWAALDRTSVSRPTALLAGSFWAAALGSRITLIVPVAILSVVLAFHIARRRPELSRRATGWTLLAFLAPVALGLCALGWYNWARFGSVLETGISYQLALLYIQAHRDELFSVQYVVQNAYNYVLMPPKIRFNFPYVWPQMGIRHPILAGLSLPSVYFAENITGLIFTAPFLLCGLGLLRAAPQVRGPSFGAHANLQSLRWLQAALAGCALGGFATFLVFFWGSERYLMDFLPAALLLAVIGSWSAIVRLWERPWARLAPVLLVLGLVTVSVVLSTLLAIAQNAEGFRQLDPHLWQQLNNVFR
jgi:hypothetical protein